MLNDQPRGIFLDQGDDRFDAVDLFQGFNDSSVEKSLLVGDDLERRPARHALVHVLVRLVRGVCRYGDRHYGGHADDDAQKRQRRPAWPALDLAECEFPEDHFFRLWHGFLSALAVWREGN